MYIHHTQATASNINWVIWTKRLGWLAGLILLLKGIVWATLPLLLIFVGISA